jgi:hypothetical protein
MVAFDFSIPTIAIKSLLQKLIAGTDIQIS